MLDPNDEKVIEESKEAGAVFVTWDRVVREAASGISPYEALDKAIAEGKGTPRAQAEVSRLHKLTPLELTILSGAANKTWECFRRYLRVDRENAKLVKQLRVDEDYSWRAVARWASSAWRGPWGANQIAGMVICEKAAKELGEDFLQPPWN